MLDNDVVAGFAVLRLLDAAEQQVVRARIRTDPRFAAALRAWEARLIPLVDALPDEAPPPAVWQAIQARIGGSRAGHSRPRERGTWLDFEPGSQIRWLHVDPITGERTAMLRMAPGSACSEHPHDHGEECFVVEGSVEIDGELLGAGDYVRAGAGTVHQRIFSGPGALLLLHWEALVA